MRNPYTLRPIVTWPGALTQERSGSPFYSYWTSTQELLDRELDMLRARNVVLQMAVTELDFRVDGQIRANARPEHPGVILAFDSKHGPLRYACDRFNDWQDNVRAIALALEALRKVERYGVGRGSEQYAGWKALTDGDASMTRQEAEELLNRYGGERAAMRATHPDHGGDAEEFQRVLKARRLLSGAV